MDGRGWQGMTIRDILEKVDLSGFSSEDGLQEKKMDNKTENNVKVEKVPSAYLGPKLWETAISLPLMEQGEDEEGEGEGAQFDVMNMEEFLAENNILLGDQASPSGSESSYAGQDGEGLNPDSPPPPPEQKPVIRPNIIVSNKKPKKVEVLELLKGDTSFLYAESKRARLEREKMERKRKLEMEIDFAPEDLALATVPGMDFNPKERSFAMDELRPQPIIKKRGKTYVPQEKKDDRYWQRRIQNNVAAKRSREARRLKENQIALRAAFLEKENRHLKQELDNMEFSNTKLQTERDILRQKLAKYEQLMI